MQSIQDRIRTERSLGTPLETTQRLPEIRHGQSFASLEATSRFSTKSGSLRNSTLNPELQPESPLINNRQRYNMSNSSKNKIDPYHVTFQNTYQMGVVVPSNNFLDTTGDKVPKKNRNSPLKRYKNIKLSIGQGKSRRSSLPDISNH